MNTHRLRLAAAVWLTGVLLAAPLTVAHAQQTREVSYSDRLIVRVNTKVRFTTMIVLPEGEEILDYVCGDGDFWVISGAQNLAYVKPAKALASTNLNLVTASGRVYSFLLAEGTGEPDIKLYITADPAEATSPTGPVKFYSAAQVEELRWAIDDGRRQVSDARRALAAARDEAETYRQAADRAAEERMAAFRVTLPLDLEFPYVFRPYVKPFYVGAIYHDGRFTYIRANAPELPALYEVLDGKPNLITFQVERGVYVVPKVLDSGYLAIGKKKFEFTRTE
jgi:type IV secretory pathway VirB9-like protein